MSWPREMFVRADPNCQQCKGSGYNLHNGVAQACPAPGCAASKIAQRIGQP